MVSWPRAPSSAPMARNGCRSPGEPNVASTMRFDGMSGAIAGRVPDPDDAAIDVFGAEPRRMLPPLALYRWCGDARVPECRCPNRAARTVRPANDPTLEPTIP
jgi:hypothetical protein